MRLLYVRRLLVCFAFVSGCSCNVFGAAPDAKQADATRLVDAAAQAEINGNNARSFALLREAVQLDPDNRLARWRLGEIQVDKNWVPVEETQRRAVADALQAEYRERRKTAGDSPQGHLLLARWCRKNKLNDEAQFHWANVLSADPKNKEALAALDLQFQKGRLVPRGQAAQVKEQMLKAKRAAEKWLPKIVQWRRAVSGSDADARKLALDQIRAIDDSTAIPSLEFVTIGRDASDPRHVDECAAIGLAFLEALQKIPGQAATESLARHAVFAHEENVRVAAIRALKPRDQHDFVPMLLAGLGMPVESTYNIMTGPDGSVHYYQTLYREGPNYDSAWESSRQAVQRDLGGRHTEFDTYTGRMQTGGPSESPLEVASKKATVAARYQDRYRITAATTEQRVARVNRLAETLNARILPALTKTTGQSFGDNPKAWWDWWRNQNEYYTTEHPVNRRYDSQVDQYTYGYPTTSLVSSAPQPKSCSCFVKGTPIWTKTGVRPIESVESGDLVLAQDVNTGELKYEPVIGRTVRPPSPIVKVSLDDEQILATKGHPFWITGCGWRMAKEVAKGEMLHGLSGSTTIRKIETASDAEAYNLVVLDMNTYFVGNHGVLVHDNTQRQPTRALVPGLALK